MSKDIENQFYDDLESLIRVSNGKFVAVVSNNIVIDVLACGSGTFDMFMQQPKFIAIQDKKHVPPVGFVYDNETGTFSQGEHFTASGSI